MTNLEESLEILEYKSLDEVTTDNLKKSFRRLALEEHPDRGGDGSGFDQLLSAYLYLSGIVRRRIGGRDQASVLHVNDILESRNQQAVDELNCFISDVFDHLQGTQDREFNERFNQQFEEYRKLEQEKGLYLTEDRGYEDWLKSTDSSVLQGVEFQKDGHYGPMTMKPPIIQYDDLHHMFEYTARCGKPEVTSVILHPEQMALRVASGGMTLLSSSTERFTSDLLERPEYSDLQDAYTVHNTMIDKLPIFKKTERTFEELLKERDIVYTTELDRDLEAIAKYEKQKEEEAIAHKQSIEQYFLSTGSSQWALPTATIVTKNSSGQVLLI